MRKMMAKEITVSTIKIAKMEMVNGIPEAKVMESHTMLGTISMEKAQREIEKLYGKGVMVFQVVPEKQVFEMEVTEFLKLATRKK